MYRSILVPLDGSPVSEHALPVACDIACRSGALLRLVHVHMRTTPAPIYVTGLPVIDEHLQPLGHVHERAYLENIRAQLDTKTGFPITVEVLNPSDADLHDQTIPSLLATHAATTDTDLIVMTTHGRSGFARFWLGSVADVLIRTSPVPVLLLRPDDVSEREQPRRPQRIVIPLDGSVLAEQILEHALELGILMQAEYTLLSIVEPFVLPGYNPIAQTHGLAAQATEEARTAAQAYLDGVAQRLEAAGARIQTSVLLANMPAIAILDQARKDRADLIAMTTHGRSGLSRLIVGSNADKVLRGAEIPLLLFRPAASHARA